MVAHFGGPVQPQLGTSSSPPRTPARAASRRRAAEVLPGLSITQHIGDLARLAETPPDAFRLFLGYAGWGSGQLIDEILRNDWLTAPVSNDLIFAPDPDASLGGRPALGGRRPAALAVLDAAERRGAHQLTPHRRETAGPSSTGLRRRRLSEHRVGEA